MSGFYFLESGDTGAVERIIAESDKILAHNLSLGGVLLQNSTVIDQRELGISTYCMESSDAVTRAAHVLGISAAREALVGWHGITYFGPLDRLPREDDLVLCRTWGQYDSELYMSDDPRALRPFFGTRQELAALLPGVKGTFEPDAVMYRQVVHRPSKSSPHMRHSWLATTPEELVAAGFVFGISDLKPSEDAIWL